MVDCGFHKKASQRAHRFASATLLKRPVNIKEMLDMSKSRGFLGILVCTMLIPAGASAESNSSRLNKERLEVGRALIEVTFDNVGSIIPYYTDDIEYHDPIVDIYGIG